MTRSSAIDRENFPVRNHFDRIISDQGKAHLQCKYCPWKTTDDHASRANRHLVSDNNAPWMARVECADWRLINPLANDSCAAMRTARAVMDKEERLKERCKELEIAAEVAKHKEEMEKERAAKAAEENTSQFKAFADLEKQRAEFAAEVAKHHEAKAAEGHKASVDLETRRAELAAEVAKHKEEKKVFGSPHIGSSHPGGCPLSRAMARHNLEAGPDVLTVNSSCPQNPLYNLVCFF